MLKNSFAMPWLPPLFGSLLLVLTGCGGAGEPTTDSTQTEQAFARGHGFGKHLHRAKSSEFARLELPFPAGVAGGRDVVFVGSPLEGRVVAFSRRQPVELGELPAPPEGFVLPFIIKSVGRDRVTVLDAGGLPSPLPFVPANPTLHEYEYRWHRRSGFTAELVRSVPFDTALIGFAEDFVLLEDGRYLVSDAVLGGLWVAEADGSISPGIVPETLDPLDAIAELAFCDSMPLIEVGDLPFLFSGSTLPGISPLAERDGILYFYSPCAEGLYAVPVASLSDDRPPHERAADIRLVSAKPDHIAVEQLLGITFNPFDSRSPYLYAADSLQLRIIRVNVDTGERQVVASDPQLFNFPSSMAFLPPVSHRAPAPLLVVSNQQHRTTLTNDAITEDVLLTPFIAAKVLVHPTKRRRPFWR